MDNTIDIKVRTGVTGTDGVRDLRQEVDGLGNALGGELKQQADQVTAALEALGAKAQAATELQQLANDAQALVVELAEVNTTLQGLEGQLPQAASAMSRLAVAESEARTAVQAASQELDEQRQALATLRDTYTGAERRTTEYKEANTQLQASVQAATQALEERSADLRVVETATKLVKEAESSLHTEYERASAALSRVNTAVVENNTELATASDRARELGVDVAHLADAERQLAAEAERATASARELVTAMVAAQWQKEAHEIVEAAEAAQRLARQTQILAEAQRELEAQKAFDRQYEASQKLSAAGEQVRMYTALWDQLEREEREAADTAQQTAQRLQQAFGTVGVRSAQDLVLEIANVRTSLSTIANSGTLAGKELQSAFATGNARVKELERDLRAARGELTLADRAAGLFKGTMSQFAGGSLIANGISNLASRVMSMGAEFLTANSKAEQLRRGLTAIYGSAAIADAQIDILRGTATRFGVSVASISDSFVKFSASAKESKIPLSVVNELFTNLVGASATLGLSGERVGLMLDALGQMAGKGVVSMEELRQQLGDSLPGALALTAKGLNLTERELIKLVESGGLLARDLFPALSTSLKSLSGDASTMTTIWGGLTNAGSLTATTVGDTGVWDILKVALKAVAVPLGALAVGFSVVTDAVLTSVRVVSSAVAAMVSGDFKSLGATVQKLTDDAVARQTKLIDAYKGVVLGAEAAAPAHAAAGQAATQSGQAAVQAGQNMQAAAGSVTVNADAHRGAAAAALSNATAQSAAGAAALASGTAAGTGTPSWQRLRIQLDETLKTAEQGAAVKDKLAKATDLAGQAAMENARLTGNERVALTEAAFAASNNATALQAASEVRTRGVAEAVRLRDALVAESAARGDPGGERAKEIEEINKTIELRRAEAEQATQAASAAKNEAATRALARQSYEDNAQSLALLRQAVEDTRKAVEGYTLAQRDGYATKEQVNEATLRAAYAEGLYNDALADSQKALERNAIAIRNKNTLAQASLEVEMLRARNAETSARALGNEASALDAVIAQRAINIRSVQATADAMRREADEAISAALRYREELRTTGQITAEKEAEIQARIDNARAKQIEADGSNEVVKGINLEIDAIRRKRSESAGGGNLTNKESLGVIGPNQQIKSTTGNTREERLAGQNAVDMNLQFQLRDKLNAGALTAADLEDMKNVIASLRQQDAVNGSASKMSAGFQSLEGQRDAQQWQSVRQRLEDVMRQMAQQEAAAKQAADQAARQVDVNLKTDGISKGTVRTNDDGAATLQRMLVELENGRRNSGRY
ncbi:tape measure protein [Variovorax boronicumulans]|uniref:tape measure protein n=1 Tax=Variovorax boronicumulans TaxID=436515 RepID=UPI001C55CED8